MRLHQKNHSCCTVDFVSLYFQVILHISAFFVQWLSLEPYVLLNTTMPSHMVSSILLYQQSTELQTPHEHEHQNCP